MKKTFIFSLVVALAFVACQKEDPTPSIETEFYKKLKSIPQMRNITVYSLDTTKYNGAKAFSEAYYADFVQPLDHKNPAVDSLYQRIIVHFAGYDRPVVLYTGGYELDEFGKDLGKPSCAPDLAQYLNANYITVEYRYFGSSTPKHLFPDANWTYLTSEQASTDLHKIYEAFKVAVFPSVKWASSGCSKGGITSTMYANFYPSDMNLYIPFCAPFMKIESGKAYNSDARIGRFLNWTGEFASEGVATKSLSDKMIASQKYMFSKRPEIVPLLKKYGTDEYYKTSTEEQIKKDYNGIILGVFEEYLAYDKIDTWESRMPKEDDDYKTTAEFILRIKPAETKAGYTPAEREDLSDNAYYPTTLKELGYFKHDIAPFVGQKYGSDNNEVTEADSYCEEGTELERKTITFDPTLMNNFFAKFLPSSTAKVVFIYGQNDFWTGAGVTKKEADSNPNFRWRKIANSGHTDYFLSYPDESDIQDVKNLINEFMK